MARFQLNIGVSDFSKFFLSSVHEFILTHPYISFTVHSYSLVIMIFLVYILLVI